MRISRDQDKHHGDRAKRNQAAITKHENLTPGLWASKTVGTRRTTYKGSARSGMQWADRQLLAGCNAFGVLAFVPVANLTRLARGSAPRVRVASGQFESILMSALPPKADIRQPD